MSRIRQILNTRLTSVATVIRILQFACFAASPIVFFIALSALPRFAATRGEMFLGVLASSAVALLLAILALVLPLPFGRHDESSQ